MKKRFLVLAMACAVALGGASFVNATGIDMSNENEVVNGIANLFNKSDEPASEKDTNKAAKIAELSAVVYNAVYVNFDKNATEAEVAAFVDLFNLIKDDATYANLNEQYYAGVTALEKGIPGSGWDQLCKVKNAYRGEGEFKRALLKKDKVNVKNEEAKKEEAAKPAAKKALPNTAAVR